jgi:hypothetical protein
LTHETKIKTAWMRQAESLLCREGQYLGNVDATELRALNVATPISAR